MRTLAEFKRAIHTGMEIECVRFETRAWNAETNRHGGEFYDIPLSEKLIGARYVSHVDTTGFYLKQPQDKSKKGSFCGFPKAADLAYNGHEFVITDRTSRGDECSRRHYKIVIK